jgi:protein phosphatase
MRIREQAGRTDAGRKRRRNEDAFVVDPPLFAVADGMGGAQAGEVASRLAAAAFREFHEADALEPEARLQAIIQEANRRIFERAQSDTAASGMGTTVTAALVGEAGVVIGHVGDSRAYRIRRGDLEQLTQDHSLVGDLMRSGRLTPEEADTHPQRSVITRALGTDPEVDVDTFTVDVADGDLFLICSDGLSTMVADDEILGIVANADGLESAGKALVKAANRRGGDDNITVVLFTLEPNTPPEDTAPIETDGRGDTEDLEDTLSGLEAAVPARPEEPTTTIGRPGGTPPHGRQAAQQAAPAAEPAPAGPRWGRRLFFALAVLLFIALLLLVAFWGLAHAHFVGAEENGSVAVYQGLPYDLGGGVSLYRARYVSALDAAQLSREERVGLFDHDLMSYGAARDRLAALESDALP